MLQGPNGWSDALFMCGRPQRSRRIGLAALGLAVVLSLLVPLTATATTTAWTYHYFHINAYGRQGYAECSNYWDSQFGFCKGPGERGPDAEPFGGNGPGALNDYSVEFEWAAPEVSSYPAVFDNRLCHDMGSKPDGYYRKVLLWGIYPSEHSYLCGWVDWPWGSFDVTSGLFYVRATRSWSTINKTQNPSLSDRGKQSGPLSLDLSYHSGDGPWGYALQISGYLVQQSCDEKCLSLTPRDT
jgi:hypothetical protein